MVPTIHRRIDRAIGGMLYMSCSSVDRLEGKMAVQVRMTRPQHERYSIDFETRREGTSQDLLWKVQRWERLVSRSGRTRIMLSRCDLNCIANQRVHSSIHRAAGD